MNSFSNRWISRSRVPSCSVYCLSSTTEQPCSIAISSHLNLRLNSLRLLRSGNDNRPAVVRLSLRNLVAFSMFGRLVPGLVRDPVDLPGLASIIRVGLLEVSRIRGDLRPDKSNIDGSALP